MPALRICALVLLLSLSVMAAPAFPEEEQWLQYRTVDAKTSDAIQVRSVSLEVLLEPPDGLALPESPGSPLRLAKWNTPLAAGGFVWFALARSGGESYDRLYIDYNCDGSLKDEDPIAAARAPGLRSYFGPVKVLFPCDEGPVAYHLNVACYAYPKYQQVSVASACWYEGTVTIGGKNAKCTLMDYNSNGSFNDVSADPKDADRIALAADGGNSVFSLGKYVQFGGKLYRPEPSPDGAFIVFTPAGDVPLGAIRLPDGIVSLTLVGDPGMFTFNLPGNTAALPAGKWRVFAWRAQITDLRGVKWSLNASDASSAPPLDVAEGAEVPVDVGPPVITSLSAAKSGAGYTLSEAFRGRFGERLSILVADAPPPAPSVRIKNADGSYDRLFQFQYG